MDKCIMIVEDDDELQTLYGLYLQGESYEILRAFNGKQALDILSKQKPDVIVLDMIMPEMDGETFLEKFHDINALQNIPIIIASVNDKIPQKYLKLAKVEAVLKKPFSVEVLLDKIKACVC